MLSDATAAHPAWIVYLRWGSDRLMARPAAFVFDTPTGFLWIEPSYFDEPGYRSAPAMHVARCEVTQAVGERWTFVGEMSGAVERYGIGEDTDIVSGLEWFATEFLPSQKKTLAELRASVAEKLRREAVNIL
jgi:hypothetical protein